MSCSTRRDFLKTGVAASVFASAAVAQNTKRAATDRVTLGKSDVKVTRLAFGTGTFSGREQRELGQDQFNRLVRHAYDRGIRFFETAESYHGMPEMLAIALKGIPRDSYVLMTKYSTPGTGAPPMEKIDQFRKQLGTEYIDILLLHCLRPPTWQSDYAAIQDGMSEAKSRKIIRSHGASIHGLPALRTVPGNQWLDIAMIRMNHNGTRMDTPSTQDQDVPGNVKEVVTHTKQVHSQGMGVISMKLCGEGRFTRFEDRDAAMRFAMNLGSIDAVTIGFKSPQEIDEAIDRMARVMNA
ncbi:MAG TPA: aldo/keto reductase [Bryobacteraceae bacterium]|jgi:predicted aldo/keto reductase-like oxidoreductase|nr:aldo/keto reductase [Bryobacteraceae bacterium]